MIPIDHLHPTGRTVPAHSLTVQDDCLQLFIPAEHPCPGPCFSIRYDLTVAQAGHYTLAIKSRGPGTGRQSRYQLAWDDQPAVPVLRRQRVLAPADQAGWLPQNPVWLIGGHHTLALRFDPGDRMHGSHRADNPLVGHRMTLAGLCLQPTPLASPAPKATPEATPEAAGSELAIAVGDTIVLFGDSITEEEHYGRHFTRLLYSQLGEYAVTVYNAGVSGNRTWEGLVRLERDVLALKPQWVVVAFGVNDGMHMPVDEYTRHLRTIVDRLLDAGLRVIVASPPGFSYVPGQVEPHMHTAVRIRGFDATVAYETRAVIDLAARAGIPCADVYGAMVHAGWDRDSLMANQWHPNDAGGRMFAIAILRELGLTAAAARTTREPLDADMYHAIAQMLPPSYRPLAITESTAPAVDAPMILATSFSACALYIFSADGRPLACRALAHHPVGMAYSPANRELYVACEGRGRIEIFQLPGLDRQDPIEPGNLYTLALVASPDGATIWSVGFFGGSLMEIDRASRSVRRSTPPIGLALDLARLDDGALAVLVQEAIVVFDSATLTETHRLPLPSLPECYYRDPDGRLHVVDADHRTTYRLDEHSMTLSDTGLATPQAHGFARDATGALLYVEDGTLYRVPPDATQPQAIASIEHAMGLLSIH